MCVCVCFVEFSQLVGPLSQSLPKKKTIRKQEWQEHKTVDRLGTLGGAYHRNYTVGLLFFVFVQVLRNMFFPRGDAIMFISILLQYCLILFSMRFVFCLGLKETQYSCKEAKCMIRFKQGSIFLKLVASLSKFKHSFKKGNSEHKRAAASPYKVIYLPNTHDLFRRWCVSFHKVPKTHAILLKNVQNM